MNTTASPDSLSGRRAEVLAAIKKFVAVNRMPPDTRDLCAMTGIRSSSTVALVLEKLEYHCFIQRRGRGGHRQIVSVLGCCAFCGQTLPENER